MKKSDGSRSHSWWWDSHISPKNSKWLQENLSEMDTKINTMLKIIEEDADSFAQRAEYYYRKRPELIVLVEDFYKTYRALVERYTFLTKEIRQNIAPALQAQLGISPESAQNSPIDLHLKRGIDGFDIVSPSYSYTGASEFDYDSPSEISGKGNTDDELSPLGFGTRYDTRSFGSKPKLPGSQEDNVRRLSDVGGFRGSVDSDITQLQRELRHLQDENKVFAAKSLEDATRLKNLQLELSNLQSRLKSLEADDKATKKTLKSVQEKEQKLVAENLKLNHGLISSKEEKSDLVEQYNKKVELACQKNKQLEDEIVNLKKENLEIHSQALERLEHIKKAEEAIQKVQSALTSMEEQSRKESLVLRETIEQQSQEFRQKLLVIEEDNTRLRRQTEADACAMKELEDRLTKLITYRNDVEQLFMDSENEKKVCQEEKAVALKKIEQLQKELNIVQIDKQILSEQLLEGGGEIERLKSIVFKLEDESAKHESAKLAGEKHIIKLEEEIEEGNRVRDRLAAQCDSCKNKCKALETVEIQLRGELASITFANAQIQEQKSTLEEMAEKASLQIKELKENVSSLTTEMAIAVASLAEAEDKFNKAELENAKIQEISVEKEAKIDKLGKQIIMQQDHIKKLEDDLASLLKEKTHLEGQQHKGLQALSELEKEHFQLRKQVEEERAQNSRSLSDHQEELRKLQDEGCAKAKIITKVSNEVNLLEVQLEKLKDQNKRQSEEFSKQLADLESQIEYLKAKLSDSLSVNVSLAEEVSEKGKTIELLNGEISGLRRQNIALTEDIALRTGHELGLQEQVNTLKEQLEFLHSELQQTLEKRHALDAEIERLQEFSLKYKQTNKNLLEDQQKHLDEISLLKKSSEGQEMNIKRLKEERALLVAESAAHLVEHTNIQNRIKTLESQCETMQIENGSLKGMLTRFEEEKKMLEKENAGLIEKLANVEGRIEQEMEKLQQASLKAKETEAALAQEQLGHLNEMSVMKKRMEDLEVKLGHLTGERELLVKEAASCREQIKGLESGYGTVQTENESLKGVIVDFEKAKSFIEEENAGLIKKLNDVQGRLQEEMEKLQQACLRAEENDLILAKEQQRHLDVTSLMKKRSEDLEVDLRLLSEERELLLKQVSECTEKIKSLETDCQALQSENVSLKEVLANNENEKQISQQVNDGLGKKLCELEGRLVAEMEKLQQACDKAKETDAALVQEQQKYSAEICLLKENIEDLETNLRKLTQERELLKEEVSARLEECTHMKQRMQSLESDCQVMQTQIGCLKEKLAIFEKAKNDVEKEKADIINVLSETKGSLVDSESRLSNALTENARLSDDVLVKGKTITILEAELLVLQNKNSTLVKDVNSLQDHVSDLQKCEASLLVDLNKSSEEIQGLTAEIELLQQTSLQEQQRALSMKQEIEELQEVVRGGIEDKTVLTRDITMHSENSNKLKLEIESLVADKVSAKKELIAAMLVGDSLKEKVSSLEVEKVQLGDILESQKEDIQNLKQTVTCLEEEKNATLGKMNLIAGEKDLLEISCTNLQKEVELHKHEVLSIKEKLVKLEDELTHVKQESHNTESSLQHKTEELKKIEEGVLVLELAKLDLEKQLQSNSTMTKAYQEEAETLKMILADVREELKTQDEQISQSMNDYKGAQKTILECHQNLDKQKQENRILEKQVSSLDVAKKLLEQAVVGLNEEIVSGDHKLKAMQHELSSLQREHEQLLLNVEALNLQLQEKETLIHNLEEKLDAADSHKLYMAEQHSKTTSDWDAKRKALEEEVVHLKSENLQSRNDLNTQHEAMIRLKDELCSLQAEIYSLQNQHDISVNQVIDDQQKIQSLESQTQEMHEENCKLAVEIEQLKQCLLQSDQEAESLRECLQKKSDDHDASRQLMKDEVSTLNKDLTSKAAIITDLNAALSSLEKKSTTISEEFALKELMVSELLTKMASVEGAHKELTLKSGNQAAEISSLKAALKDHQQVQTRDLPGINNVQEVDKLRDALPKLEEENRALHTRLAAQSAELIRKNEIYEKLVKIADAREAEASQLELQLDQIMEENKEAKLQVHIASDEVSQVKGEVQKLMLQVRIAQEQYQQEHVKHNACVAELQDLKNELQNLKDTVSTQQVQAEKLEEEISSLYQNKNDMEATLGSVNCQLNDSQVVSKDLIKMKDALRHELDQNIKLLLNITSDLEDLNALLSKNKSILTQGNLDLGGFDRRQTYKTLQSVEGLHSLEFTNGEAMGEENPVSKSLMSSQNDSIAEGQPEEFGQKGVLCAMTSAIKKLKDTVLTLLEENDLLKVTASVEHSVLENSLKELQSEFSYIQDENVHQKSELCLYKSEINYFLALLEGKCGHDEAMAGHTEVKQLQSMLYNLHSKALTLEEDSVRLIKEMESMKGEALTVEEDNVRLIKEMESLKGETGKSQQTLSDIESKYLMYAVQLKDNLFSCHAEVKLIGEEFQNGTNEADPSMMTRMEKLNSWQKNGAQHEGLALDKDILSFEMRESTIQKDDDTTLASMQLQERVEESILLLEALGILKLMLRESSKNCIFKTEAELDTVNVVEKQEPIPNGDKKTFLFQSNGAVSRSEDSVALRYQEDRHFIDAAKDGTEENDDESEIMSIKGGEISENLSQSHDRPDAELMQGYPEALQTNSVEGENENKEVYRLSHSHTNLGRRLYQAQMDEKLENELLELKEEHKKLEEELQARVEQVERNEKELGMLQAQLEEGNEQQETMDQRKLQIWLQKRRKAERRASKLMQDLVVQRQQVSNLQEVVLSWTKQQEAVTDNLEEQVSSIVSQESASTMDGWDDEQVNHLLKEMQSHKAWTRKHSLELQSVEKELQRVSSTIEITQRQLLIREGAEADLKEEDEAYDEQATPQVTPSSSISGGNSINRRQHRGRIRLNRFLFFLIPGKKGCFKGCFKRIRSNSSRAIHESPTRSPRHSSMHNKSAASSAAIVTGKKVKCWTCCICIKKPRTSQEL